MECERRNIYPADQHRRRLGNSLISIDFQHKKKTHKNFPLDRIWNSRTITITDMHTLQPRFMTWLINAVL